MAADPERTWTAKREVDSNTGENEGESQKATSSDYVDWLQDETMLPNIVPNARIMRYGYWSDGFGRDGVPARASEIAQTLLKFLQKKREDEVVMILRFQNP